MHCPAALSPGYAQSRPQDEPLHRLLREHLATFLEQAEDPDRGTRAPRFVERELKAILRCRLPQFGFLRAFCDQCRQSAIIPFCCKSRVCPSCATRRAEDLTEHLTARVVPEVPVRQFVLSIPFELHLLVGYQQSLFSAVSRIFTGEVFRFIRTRAKAEGFDDARPGAISFLQRFNSALRVHPHLHVVALNGFYIRDSPDEPPAFHPIAPPTPTELDAISRRVAERVLRVLRRRGLLADEGEDAAEREPDDDGIRLLEAAQRTRAEWVCDDGQGQLVPTEPDGPRRSVGAYRGFGVHANVFIPAHDGDGRRRLLRYCARPPFAQSQIRIQEDGRVAFQLRRRRRDGATHILLHPLAFIARVGAMIAPPRFNLTRYSGVLAARAAWRKEVVPQPKVDLKLAPNVDELSKPETEGGVGMSGTPYRQAWATLLARIYKVDALACSTPGCDGRLRIIAAILKKDAIRGILEHLGLDPDPPACAPARDPPQLVMS
jgi:hypothetical protein